ncbi:ATP-binding protein [Rhodocyclus gracilis]|uniref:Uncharacterized protein n=1 Tax=Rhodocyclus tenuis TaxID=1066 RepID=A0A6L5JXA9_RHOTE|nr:ATP-binding protein [Rhodocyclus gracilis]MQY50838.1 hypothetical protein [Rhodocyclus gracilis]
MRKRTSGAPALARIIAVIGASGSGKTEWIKRQLKAGRPSRLVVWDAKPTSDYSAFGQVFTSISDLGRAMLAAGKSGELRAIFRPGFEPTSYKEKFDRLCRLAFHWKNCTLVAEELATVTRAGWSPPGWLLCVTQGRSEGLTIFGISQRPALIDKTIIGNATLIHCGRLQGRNDRKVMADELDCDPDELRNLQQLEWIERADTGETRRGRLEF